ncbi:MAG TPA: hypothetical protein PLZ97_12605, partial [Sediminibacterium sp.]|nr:hypothetical protein [Sediminibacterium sp.]
IYAYSEFNRKTKGTKDMDTAFSLNATSLISEFEKDFIISNSKYLNKVIEVEGTVKSVEDQTGYTIVFGDSSSSTSIRCTMDSSFKLGFKLKAGQLCSIKGIYTGFNADDLGIGSDIIISKSIIKP